MKPRHLATMVGVAFAACSDAPPDGRLGAAEDPQVGAYCIAGVRASPGTAHFTGLRWLLSSTEGTGPIVLTTHVGTLVQPTMSTTVTGVEPEAVSRAVGYSLVARHDLIALSAQTLNAAESSRLEAYTAFQESTWEVRDAQCGALLGAGASFNPSGVFFQTVPAFHVPLPDMSLFGLVQGCEDLTCAPLPEPGGESDAGASDAGASAAEASDRQVPGFLPAADNPALTRHAGRR